MKASILFGTLGAVGVTCALAQWSAAVNNGSSGDIAADGRNVSLAASATVSSSRRPTADGSRANDQSHSDAQTDEREAASAGDIGADIVYSSIHQIIHFSLSPDHEDYDPDDPIHAYSLGSQTCNIGDEPLDWINNGTPGFASNVYRLHDGRLKQIGLGWVKHACCVANVNNPNVCFGLECQPGPLGTLRPGCLDTYSASWNAIQNRLGPRTNIDPYAGAFSSLATGTFNSIERRLQVRQSDLDQSKYPDALYFVEGVYVCTDTAEAGNWFNNATYRRTTVNQNTFAMELAPEEQPTVPAIFAWQDHGGGVNNTDDTVEIKTVDLPSEGRFFAAAKVTDNEDGTWRYEYALYNLNSHQAAGGFSVARGEGATITNVGFYSPYYHSGEEQDDSPWEHEVSSASITWSTTETYQENPNANALRWGSMYNFWFDADQPPVKRDAAISVFIPGADEGVSFFTEGPAAACPADLSGSGEVGVEDLIALLQQWGECDDDDCPADLNEDGAVDVLDLLLLLEDWGACPE